MLYKETEEIELKGKRVDDLNKEIVAFLNTNGGIIYVGIGDDGTVFGVANLNNEMLAVNNVVRDSILPNALPFVLIESIVIEMKDVIVLTISKGTSIPYYSKRQGFSENGIYIRVGTSKRKANPEEIRQMTIDSRNMPFEQGLSVR